MTTLAMTRNGRPQRILRILTDAEKLISAASIEMEQVVPIASLNIYNGPSLYYYSDIIRAIQEVKHFCMAKIAEPENGPQENE